MAEDRQFNAPAAERGDRRGGAATAATQTRSRLRRRRVCAFCADKIENIDYKDINTLRRFISEQGQIESRRRTGTCARHQRRLTLAVKRARFLALLPYTAEHVRRYSS